MKRKEIAIILPCFNENNTLISLIEELEVVLKSETIYYHLVVVDDGSTDDTVQLLKAYKFTQTNIGLTIVSHNKNYGHQAAILTGLKHARGLEAERYIVMDSDGEDDPEAITKLSQTIESEIVFVTRSSRSETVGFRIGYFFYRLIFFLIVNKKINFGNYSMISQRVADIVIGDSFIHYAAYLSKLKHSKQYIPQRRRKRINGQSKMKYGSLIVHGFKSLLEYSERLLLFFLKFFLLLLVFFFVSICTVVFIRIFTDYAIPGWASNLVATLFNAMLICLGFFIIGFIQTKLLFGKPAIVKQVIE